MKKIAAVLCVVVFVGCGSDEASTPDVLRDGWIGPVIMVSAQHPQDPLMSCPTGTIEIWDGGRIQDSEACSCSNPFEAVTWKENVLLCEATELNVMPGRQCIFSADTKNVAMSCPVNYSNRISDLAGSWIDERACDCQVGELSGTIFYSDRVALCCE
jgi:hypothetical protein